MTQQKPTTASDIRTRSENGLGKDEEGHLPASESDRAISTEERDTHLPASESDDLESSDTGERIVERGLTRLPPG